MNWVLNGVRWKNESKKDAVLDNGPSQHKQIPQGGRSLWSSKSPKRATNRGVLGVRGQRSLPREGEGGLHMVLGADVRL